MTLFHVPEVAVVGDCGRAQAIRTCSHGVIHASGALPVVLQYLPGDIVLALLFSPDGSHSLAAGIRPAT
ncbi:hypothetical protein [Microbacterium sp. Root61]|uniref:hypothetical protein n=1 Tax=Microbacterium sp. Root61 TaxID=1736570 RepID=UPI00138F518C|nr:hypothetical protein [Microbacterium sp. Root61]